MKLEWAVGGLPIDHIGRLQGCLGFRHCLAPLLLFRLARIDRHDPRTLGTIIGAHEEA